MDTTSRFWDRTAPKYAAQPIADEEAYRTKLELTRALLRDDMTLLELGCGTGGTAIRHAPHVHHVTAVDFSETMLDFARRRAAEAGVENVTFLKADVTSYTPQEGSLDMVLTLSLLHLLKDPEHLVGRISGMLRPGGYFVSSTACLGDRMRFMKYLGPAGKALGLLPQLNVFCAAELVAMIERQGFAIRHHWQPRSDAAVFIIAQRPE